VIGQVLEVAESGRYLHKDRGFLIVSYKGDELGRVPLDDLAAVVISAPGSSYSNALVVALAERGVTLVCCDNRFAPVAWLWPVSGHYSQASRMRAQAGAAKPLRKRLWKSLVQSKICGQAEVLQRLGKPYEALIDLANRVRSGDPENREAQAARRYWSLLLGPGFRRRRAGLFPNDLLNYGYTVLRSATARSVCAAGLHPSLGVHHHRSDNPMCLVDDLVEPFRPAIDLQVSTLLRSGVTEIGPASKALLVATLRADLRTQQGTSPLSVCVQRLASSVARSFETKQVALELPSSVLTARTEDSNC